MLRPRPRRHTCHRRRPRAGQRSRRDRAPVSRSTARRSPRRTGTGCRSPPCCPDGSRSSWPGSACPLARRRGRSRLRRRRPPSRSDPTSPRRDGTPRRTGRRRDEGRTPAPPADASMSSSVDQIRRPSGVSSSAKVRAPSSTEGKSHLVMIACTNPLGLGRIQASTVTPSVRVSNPAADSLVAEPGRIASPAIPASKVALPDRSGPIVAARLCSPCHHAIRSDGPRTHSGTTASARGVAPMATTDTNNSAPSTADTAQVTPLRTARSPRTCRISRRYEAPRREVQRPCQDFIKASTRHLVPFSRSTPPHHLTALGGRPSTPRSRRRTDADQSTAAPSRRPPPPGPDGANAPDSIGPRNLWIRSTDLV